MVGVLQTLTCPGYDLTDKTPIIEVTKTLKYGLTENNNLNVA